MTVFPRPASTVVLIDEMSRVYLTKRPESMKFFGGFYVFPGGAVEESDYAQDDEYIKGWDEKQSFDPAYYIAAARELFEEVGVLLAIRADGVPAQITKQKEFRYRQLLVNGEISFFQMLREESLYFSQENIHYFGNLVTPKDKPIRFDARFFLAQLPTGQSPSPDKEEIDDAAWFSPDDALSACHAGNISLAPPTILAIETIKTYLEGGPLIMPELKQ